MIAKNKLVLLGGLVVVGVAILGGLHLFRMIQKEQEKRKRFMADISQTHATRTEIKAVNEAVERLRQSFVSMETKMMEQQHHDSHSTARRKGDDHSGSNGGSGGSSGGKVRPQHPLPDRRRPQEQEREQDRISAPRRRSLPREEQQQRPVQTKSRHRYEYDDDYHYDHNGSRDKTRRRRRDYDDEQEEEQDYRKYSHYDYPSRYNRPISSYSDEDEPMFNNDEYYDHHQYGSPTPGRASSPPPLSPSSHKQRQKEEKERKEQNTPTPTPPLSPPPPPTAATKHSSWLDTPTTFEEEGGDEEDDDELGFRSRISNYPTEEQDVPISVHVVHLHPTPGKISSPRKYPPPAEEIFEDEDSKPDAKSGNLNPNDGVTPATSPLFVDTLFVETKEKE